ncbi:hypothetical protein N7676_22930 [Stenotrophomonas sp. GD03993]|uniref:hypothetical protein n=1 Tax=unclassified Stenotrophomonas TaxID=196198 RepID=UPI0018D46C23|nr:MULTISPECIES: hypothetical protein [Stenotrophomonas]MBH1461934.1 hypothetical protein [Stenotrophomonas maltophilia]MDH0188854.1 hypothetical protein [Stenotrophomonas sp. GD04051]MDH0466669.1 hypothetical protein [Stenotrophomonas sp. GD03993]MDH0876871.1 hypothetical protein [Stenotrophomonas sp. GD03877]MDH2156967.1 hypothetical protein [Stenotrophomonas sp. GD03657]
MEPIIGTDHHAIEHKDIELSRLDTPQCKPGIERAQIFRADGDLVQVIADVEVALSPHELLDMRDFGLFGELVEGFLDEGICCIRHLHSPCLLQKCAEPPLDVFNLPGNARMTGFNLLLDKKRELATQGGLQGTRLRFAGTPGIHRGPDRRCLFRQASTVGTHPHCCPQGRTARPTLHHSLLAAACQDLVSNPTTAGMLPAPHRSALHHRAKTCGNPDGKRVGCMGAWLPL